MIKEREAGGPVEKPDWVDVLLAASLVAWATIVGATFVLWFVPAAVGSPHDAVPLFYGFLLTYCFFGFVLATAVCAVVGLPALALADWLSLSEWWQAAIVGAAAGFLVAIAPLPLPAAMGGGGSTAHFVVFLAAGALAGVAAWRKRRRGNQAS